MKRLFMCLLLLILMPMIVFADEGVTTTVEDTTTSTEVTKSPDTGVEDYFITLGAVSIILGGTLYIINKKNAFAQI